MSTSQIVSIAAASLAVLGSLVAVLEGWMTWGEAVPTILAGLGVLGIHPNLPTA